MSVQLCTITALAVSNDGTPLYLASDSSKRIYVATSPSENTQWQRVDQPVLAATMFVHHATGFALAAVSGQSALTLDPSTLPTISNTWTLGDCGNGAFAIRPTGNDAFNLNIAGDNWVANTEVIIYHWDDAPNSKWRIINI